MHWTYDTWAMGHGVARGVLAQGGKTWFFVTADYAFGHDLEKQATRRDREAEGGQVLGSVRHPLGASDFSSFLLQAQASGAQVIGLANAGGDTVNTIKQAAEFNLGEKQKIVALIFDLQSVPALGLKTAQGIVALNAFYWDLNDETRAWSTRYQERHTRRRRCRTTCMPASIPARWHYLNAVDKVGSPADGRAVVAAMKATPIDDPLFGHVTIREDGRAMHAMYLLQVKSPAESKEYLGCLQDDGDDRCRTRLPSAQRGRLSAGGKIARRWCGRSESWQQGSTLTICSHLEVWQAGTPPQKRFSNRL